MNKIKFTVAKVSAITEKGNYIHTIKTEGKSVKFAGMDMKGAGQTYFVALQQPIAVDGKAHETDLDLFDIVERKAMLEYTDEATGDTLEREYAFKWLFPKR
jgi:hypothetical protein